VPLPALHVITGDGNLQYFGEVQVDRRSFVDGARLREPPRAPSGASRRMPLSALSVRQSVDIGSLPLDPALHRCDRSHGVLEAAGVGIPAPNSGWSTSWDAGVLGYFVRKLGLDPAPFGAGPHHLAHLRRTCVSRSSCSTAKRLGCPQTVLSATDNPGRPWHQ
jgi:hypothetical protein